MARATGCPGRRRRQEAISNHILKEMTSKSVSRAYVKRQKAFSHGGTEDTEENLLPLSVFSVPPCEIVPHAF